MSAKKIVVLGTGGTLAGAAATPGDNVGYKAAQFGIADLLARIPALGGLALVSEQVVQIDSKDMGFATWQLLLHRCQHWLQQEDVQGVVITHGTDTLEETAYFLQSVLAPAKPLVLTCAMRPATSLSPDGPQNIVDAIAVARSAGAQGVVAVCAGTIHSAADISKVHTYRLDPFSSGDAGPIGYVEEGQLRLVRNWPAGQGMAPGTLEKVLGAMQPPRVDIVLSHAGADGVIVDALLASGVQGLVVAGTGNGTVHHMLEAALVRAQAQGVKVLRCSRCAEGRVIAHAADPLPSWQGSPVKARVELLLQLLREQALPAPGP